MDHVIEAIHKRSGRIRLLAVPANLCAILITLALGGSAGKEGPCAYLGAALSSLFADLLRFDHIHRKKLVICGISAGFEGGGSLGGRKRPGGKFCAANDHRRRDEKKEYEFPAFHARRIAGGA